MEPEVKFRETIKFIVECASDTELISIHNYLVKELHRRFWRRQKIEP